MSSKPTNKSVSFCQEKMYFKNSNMKYCYSKIENTLPLTRLKFIFVIFQTKSIHKNTENRLDSRYFSNYFAVCFLIAGKISVAINSMFSQFYQMVHHQNQFVP